MKRSIIATALCGVLMSPLADSKSWKDKVAEISVSEYWALMQKGCEKGEGSEESHDCVVCKAWLRDSKSIFAQKKTKKEAIQMAISLVKRYVCDDDSQRSSYNISRNMCEKIVTERVRDCESEFIKSPEMSETAVYIDQFLDFQICIVPELACSAADNSDKVLKQHCLELERDRQG